MRAVWCFMMLLAGLAAPVWLTLAAQAPAAQAQDPAPPACKGRDILAQLATTDPKAHARILASAEETVNGGAILWRIEPDDAPASHLFGTIHLTDPRVNRLSPEAEAAFTGAEAVVLEAVDLTPARMSAAMSSLGETLFFRDGKSLAQFLEPAEMAQVAEIVADSGLPGAFASLVKPWFVTVLIAVPECERRRAVAGLASLDARIEARARARGVKPQGLETPEEQLRAMASLPMEAQVEWLKANLDLQDKAEDSLESLIQLYLDRRVGAVWPLTRHMAGEDREMDAAIQGFQKALIEIRNTTMADRLEPILAKGNAFIGVGALHLPGKVGLVHMLRQRGYKVVPVN